MSIDATVFAELLGELEAYYKRDLTPFVKRVWYKHLNQLLSTEEFAIAVEQAFVSKQFMPTPAKLVEVVKGDAETLALQEWEQCIKAAARNDKEMIAQLSPQGQSALHLAGGLYKLGMATEDELKWVKKEFVSAWKSWSTAVNPILPSATAVLALPQGVGCEMSEQVRSLSGEMSLNGCSKA